MNVKISKIRSNICGKDLPEIHTLAGFANVTAKLNPPPPIFPLWSFKCGEVTQLSCLLFFLEMNNSPWLDFICVKHITGKFQLGVFDNNTFVSLPAKSLKSLTCFSDLELLTSIKIVTSVVIKQVIFLINYLYFIENLWTKLLLAKVVVDKRGQIK